MQLQSLLAVQDFKLSEINKRGLQISIKVSLKKNGYSVGNIAHIFQAEWFAF